MSQANPSNTPSLFGEVLRTELKDIVKEVVEAAISQNGHRQELLTADQLAERLNVPISWVYEQSRQGNIPTHRLGRYIRFNLNEVLGSQKKD
jgi:excisionase family DNA binding protein